MRGLRNVTVASSHVKRTEGVSTSDLTAEEEIVLDTRGTLVKLSGVRRGEHTSKLPHELDPIGVMSLASSSLLSN